jgi:ferredoxin
MGTGADAVVLDVAGFGALVAALAADRRLIAPTVRDGAIVLDEIAGVDDLPRGWTDEQAPGRYRLARRDDDAFFGYAVGPRSWRARLDPPAVHLVTIRRRADDPTAVSVEPADPAAGVGAEAWLGVRGCDLAGLAISDRVFLGGDHPDPHYAARRAAPLVVAVDCASPADTCFCTSMGTGPAAVGPAAGGPVDLHITEVCGPGRHEFVCRVGTEAGRAVLEAAAAGPATGRPATAADHAAAEAVVAAAAASITRRLDTDGLRERLAANPEDPRWDDVADRCLACANCTLVCPTCFCSIVEDRTDLSTLVDERVRVWDSCFTLGHSYLHGGSVHASVRSRYRQWLTHKLSTWWDQFDTSGCVGCGRCLTWCPVGIDLTEEAAAIGRAAAPASAAEAGS